MPPQSHELPEGTERCPAQPSTRREVRTPTATQVLKNRVPFEPPGPTCSASTIYLPAAPLHARTPAAGSPQRWQLPPALLSQLFVPAALLLSAPERRCPVTQGMCSQSCPFLPVPRDAGGLLLRSPAPLLPPTSVSSLTTGAQ